MPFSPANLDLARDTIAKYPHRKSAVLPLNAAGAISITVVVAVPVSVAIITITSALGISFRVVSVLVCRTEVPAVQFAVAEM